MNCFWLWRPLRQRICRRIGARQTLPDRPRRNRRLRPRLKGRKNYRMKIKELIASVQLRVGRCQRRGYFFSEPWESEMATTPRPWVVERHDQDDGSISYEIWCQTRPYYHRVVTLNDWDNNHAREDADLIVRAVNATEDEDPKLGK